MKSIARFPITVWFSFLMVTAALAADKPKPQEPRPVLRPPTHAEVSAGQIDAADKAERFVVKIINLTSNLFTPEVEGAHGTGFIVELTPERGVIFTNNHVVSCGPHDAQRIYVQFAALKGLPEQVQGKVVYRSPLLDFAVVEFDPRKLKRVKSTIAVAELAQGEDFARLAARGNQVMAFGHPLDTNNVSTFGVISGLHKDQNRGVYLQTSAPINPGNSGGPLLELVEGKVIGMNTAKIVGADNVGYAIPIPLILNAYVNWRRNPKLAHERAILARFNYYPANGLKLEQLDELVEKAEPDFFDNHEGMLLVTDTSPVTNLKVGDLIFKVNGITIGHEGHLLDELALQSDGVLEMLIIRNKTLQIVKVPVLNLGFAQLRQQVDFVLAAGLLLAEHWPDREWAVASGESRVAVFQVLPYTPAGEIGQIAPGSLIVELQIDGKSYPIKRLNDVKQALKHRKEGQPVRVVYHPPIAVEGKHGAQLLTDLQFSAPLVMRERKVALLPIDQVITPRNLSLRLMKSNFDFTGKRPETRDWRFWVGKTSCSKKLALEADTGETQIRF